MPSLSLPPFAVTYGVAAAAFFLFGFTRRGGRTAQAIGGVLAVIAALNAYVESRAIAGIVRFPYATLVLILGFALTYTILCLRLMEQIGVKRRAFVFSYLPLAYAFLLGFPLVAPRMAKLENPALALYVGIAFSFALHVPLFAAGKSQAAKIPGVLESAPEPSIYAFRPWWFSGSLGLLVLFVLFVSVLAGTDWRLYSLNGVMTSLLSLLCVIARPPR